MFGLPSLWLGNCAGMEPLRVECDTAAGIDTARLRIVLGIEGYRRPDYLATGVAPSSDTDVSNEFAES